MTTENDPSTGASGQTRAPAKVKSTGSATPPAIEMNMPASADAKPRRKNAASMDDIESLLRNLMDRLDENDRRYGGALNEMNARLNQLSDRAKSARGAKSSPAGAALDRVQEHARTLAEQINEAGSARRDQQGDPMQNFEQRIGALAGANDDSSPYFGNDQLSGDFAEVTERLERSLASRAPAGDFDALSHRMDELAQRFDTALANRNDVAALQNIESQLKALTAGFSEARHNYTRVEAIESHLMNLMDWAQNSGASSPGDDSRLNAIEENLRALNENAREMDARTVGTLEAMNEALHSLASSIKTPGDTRMANDGFEAAEQTDSLREPEPQAAPEDLAEVWINERHEAHPDAREPGKLGATIPDYEPSPGQPVQAAATGADETAASLAERVEPTFDDKNDFIASARRAAAAAAAQEPAPRPSQASGRAKKRLAGMSAAASASGSKRPRSIFIIAALALLIASMGLLFSRLKNQSSTLQTGTSMNLPGNPPAMMPEKPAGAETAPRKTGQDTPRKDKQHSQRMENALPAREPAPVPNPEPARAALTAPGSGGSANAAIPAAMPISTATVLASLPPSPGAREMEGVSVEIKEPAPRTRPRAAAPALVPPTETAPRPNPMPLPKRAPATNEANRTLPANTTPVDSAPANEMAPEGETRQGDMPPARIGPYSLRLAASRGNHAAQVEVASRYAKGTGVAKDLKQAAEWYHRAAAKGYAPAQYRLAALYERGQGVKKDEGIARTWYRRAAELGNVRAMHNLAVLYTRAGKGRPDYVSAKNWFHEAARHGLADSQYNLGILYESGLGVQKNAAEAFKWFTLASRQGDGEALKRREALRTQLPARSLKDAEKTIASWNAAPVKSSANASGPPRGGWHNAKARSGDAADPARIARAQFLLNKLGFDAGEPDGKIGPKTAAAIRRFENRTGSHLTGKVTGVLLKRLEAAAG